MTAATAEAPHVIVQIPGGTTKIELTEEPMTVGAALAGAAKQLGVEVDPERLTAIKDGEQVGTDQQVTSGDEITAAPNVGNGAGVS